MAKKKEDEFEVVHEKYNLSEEIWGVIFMALGLLIMISLASFLINDNENILGPWLGTRLSLGLTKLFGSIPATAFPIVIFFMGITMFRGGRIPIRFMLYSLLLTFQLCIMLAIYNLPVVHTEGFVLPQNIVGYSIIYLFYYVFGPHTFGPYFLLFTAAFITIAIMLKLNLRLIAQTLYTKIKLFILSIIDKMKLQNKASTDNIVENKIVKKQKSVDRKETNHIAKGNDDNLLQKELENFRKKSDNPINIITHDCDINKDENEEDAGCFSIPSETIGIDSQINVENNDSGTDDIGVIDASLINDADEQFTMIPQENDETNKIKKHQKPYQLPNPDILNEPPASTNIINRMEIEENSHTLEKTLLSFGIEGKVINVSPGPVVTRYEITLAPGIKINKIVNLQDDISLAVGGKRIRIEAPIPGKKAVGIELPNAEMQIVHFKQILTSDIFKKSKAKLPIVVGRSISGAPYVADISKMPHLLIAGQTGAGKSVGINSFICSMLMTKTPEELRLILIDPKKVEMSYYEGLPHLISPVVTESKEAVSALQWGVGEMTRRYKLLAKVHARNIESFNQKIEEKTIDPSLILEEDNKKLPFIVIIVDELADLMMTASRDVEGLIQRIAQLARAVGIHLVVATQRPSVDIITGPIKANLTSRISFRTIQSTDSRTILGCVGAEKLLGRGDMLFLKNGAPEVERCHGSFISEEDVENIVTEIKKQSYNTDTINNFQKLADTSGIKSGKIGASGNERDENFEEAARMIVSTGLGSTSMLQRRLKLGYARAGRVMDELEEAGLVGSANGSKAREVLATKENLDDMFGE